MPILVKYNTGKICKQSHLTLSCMDDFQTHISKCSEKNVKLNFLIFLKGHPQQKCLQGQEFSGMGALR